MSRILDNLQPIHFIHVREVMKYTMSKKTYVRIFKNTDNVMNAMIVMVLKVVIKGMKIMIIGPLNLVIHGIRVASAIAFSVCVYVLCGFSSIIYGLLHIIAICVLPNLLRE